MFPLQCMQNEWLKKIKDLSQKKKPQKTKTKKHPRTYASFPHSPPNLSRFLLKLDCYYEITSWRICFCSNADVWTMLCIAYSIDVWFFLTEYLLTLLYPCPSVVKVEIFHLLVFWAVVRSDSMKRSFWIIFHSACLSKLQIRKFSIPFLQADAFWLNLMLHYYSRGGMCLSFREESLLDVCRWTATSWIQIKWPQPECGALSCCHFTFTLQLIWNVFFL